MSVLGMTVPEWVLWLGYIGAALVALKLIWATVVAFMHAFNKIDRLVLVIDPVTQIAEDFKKNGGKSLRDAIDRIDKASILAAANAEVAVKIAGESAEASKQVKAEVAEISIVVRRTATDAADNGRLLVELREHSTSVRDTQNLILERGRILRRSDDQEGSLDLKGKTGKAHPRGE